MPKAKKVKEPAPLLIPEANPRIKRWVVLGLDPSMSRTGFAFMEVRPAIAHTPEEAPFSTGIWTAAGSIKPTPIDDPNMDARSTVWIRAKCIATYIRELVKTVVPPVPDKGDMHQCKTPDCCVPDVGLIICMEYPTPQNDYLWSVNRIINLCMFEDGEVAARFGEVRILLVNASTNRSQMGLIQRGNKNKGENILKAYEFIDRERFPELDTESCDGVLMAIWGRHAASVMLGTSEEIPLNFKISLCNATQEGRGKGRNAYTITKGILHRNEYWYKYERRGYEVRVKDATNPTKSLSRINFTV
jgi:hypothetical protein